MATNETIVRAARIDGQPVALVDVDGVKFDFQGRLAEAAVELTGRPRSDFVAAEVWNFFIDQWGWTLDEFIGYRNQATRDHGLFRFGTPLEGSVEGWRILRDAGVRIHVVTDLNLGDVEITTLAREQRIAWLSDWEFDFDEITFTGDKGVVVGDYLNAGCAVWSIDDRDINVDDLHAAGARSFLRHQAWNRDHEVEAVRRVPTFAHFAEIVAAHHS